MAGLCRSGSRVDIKVQASFLRLSFSRNKFGSRLWSTDDRAEVVPRGFCPSRLGERARAAAFLRLPPNKHRPRQNLARLRLHPRTVPTASPFPPSPSSPPPASDGTLPTSFDSSSPNLHPAFWTSPRLSRLSSTSPSLDPRS